MSFAKMLPALAVPVVAVAAAIPANADQYSFVSMLDNNGVYYTSIMDMIDTGKQVCRIVRTGYSAGPVTAANYMLMGQGFASTMDRSVIIQSAAANMCPDIWPEIRAHTAAVERASSGGNSARTVNSQFE